MFLPRFHSIHVEFRFLGLTFILHSARGYILERNERRRNLLLEYSIRPREELYLLQRGQQLDDETRKRDIRLVKSVVWTRNDFPDDIANLKSFFASFFWSIDHFDMTI